MSLKPPEAVPLQSRRAAHHTAKPTRRPPPKRISAAQTKQENHPTQLPSPTLLGTAPHGRRKTNCASSPQRCCQRLSAKGGRRQTGAHRTPHHAQCRQFKNLNVLQISPSQREPLKKAHPHPASHPNSVYSPNRHMPLRHCKRALTRNLIQADGRRAAGIE